MKEPKFVCMDRGLYSHQAEKGAEVMRQYITENILAIMQTCDVIPVHVRLAEFLDLKIPDNEKGE